MVYMYFALAAVCFFLAALLEIRRRKTPIKSKAKSGASSEKYLAIEHKEKQESENVYKVSKGHKHEVPSGKQEEETSSKFDHLFKIKPEYNENSVKAREDILKEAENIPEIPKVGSEERFEPLYFRVSEEPQSESTTTQQQNVTQPQPTQIHMEKPQPKDWLFFDPSSLESKKDDSEKKEKKDEEDNSWTPAFFFGDEAR
jgi:FtsZ-interacting cell division protein ZipA